MRPRGFRCVRRWRRALLATSAALFVLLFVSLCAQPAIAIVTPDDNKAATSPAIPTDETSSQSVKTPTNKRPATKSSSTAGRDTISGGMGDVLLTEKQQEASRSSESRLTAGDAKVTTGEADASTATKPQRVTEIYVDEPRSARADLLEEEFEGIDIPLGLFEVVDGDSGGRRQNYASLDAGATILDSSSETKSPTNLLVPDKDRYMMVPCQKSQKWVVISLSEDVQADAIVIANYEKFSSPFKDFIVLGSVNYPTDTWLVLGNFTAEFRNGEQVFPLDSYQHVRYIKLRFFSHYGSEYYCTLSQLKVHGRTFTQVISQLEMSIDAEVNVLESAQALPQPSIVVSPEDQSSEADGAAGVPSSTNASANSTCVPMDSLLEFQSLIFNGSAVDKPGCCDADEFEEEAPKLADNADPVAVSEPSKVGDQRQTKDGEKKQTAPSPSAVDGAGPNSASANKTASPSVEAVSGSVAKANSSTSSSTSSSGTTSLSTSSAGAIGGIASTQSLGRLENIFVRLTKKIQALEANQVGLTEQLKEIRVTLNDLNTRVTTEFARNDRLLADVRRDNIALWNEMLIVRDVITTMKAGILCAIILSALIIAVYLLRLLLRCVSKCKERADLREWFWRMEADESSSANHHSNTTNGATDEVAGAKAALRVNRKQQFGKSWDDSAIERKTLYREMVDVPHRVRRHHRSKKARTASLTFSPSVSRAVK